MYKSVEAYEETLEKLFRAKMEGKIADLAYKLGCLEALDKLLRADDGGDEWIAVHYELCPEYLFENGDSVETADLKDFACDAIEDIMLFKKYGFNATVSRLKNELIDVISEI